MLVCISAHKEFYFDIIFCNDSNCFLLGVALATWRDCWQDAKVTDLFRCQFKQMLQDVVSSRGDKLTRYQSTRSFFTHPGLERGGRKRARYRVRRRPTTLRWSVPARKSRRTTTRAHGLTKEDKLEAWAERLEPSLL